MDNTKQSYNIKWRKYLASYSRTIYITVQDTHDQLVINYTELEASLDLSVSRSRLRRR